MDTVISIERVVKTFGAARARDGLLERFALDPSKKCRTYSKGNRQKVALVAAFAPDVEPYILDEPTSGLDPRMETVFQDLVRELQRAGRTVLLSSHDVRSLTSSPPMLEELFLRHDGDELAELEHHEAAAR